MTISAVVFDIGGVLEVIDDSQFPGPFEQRHRLAPGAVAAASDFPADPSIGLMSEAEVRGHWQRRLGLDDAATDELLGDYWRWYTGTLDKPLFEWLSRARKRGLRVGILSNSGPGAREAERRYGFERIADDIVYSHEVGLAKPDPAVYALTIRRLGVRCEQTVLLDDVPANIDAARAAGWHGILHTDTSTSITELDRLVGHDARAATTATDRSDG